MKKIILSLLLLTGTALITNAQDRVFTRTYQTNVIPLGAMELEYWNTIRVGHEDYYGRLDQRIELELGLGKNVQTAFYVILEKSTMHNVSDSSMVNTSNIGFLNEWKIKLSDPVANKVGFGLYGEIGFSGDEVELEAKILLDKRISDNLFAFNLVGETEIEFEVEAGENEVEAEFENSVELDFGYMRFIGKKKINGIGFEIRNHNEFEEEDGWKNSVWFAGPTAHFGGKRWFVNLNVMPQLYNAKKEDGSNENLELTSHEKVDIRTIVSFAF